MAKILAIGGGSASGKTTIARRLAEQLRCAHIEVDSFYHDFTDLTLTQKKLLNWDDPESIDREKFYETLQKLKKGEPVSITEYDFDQYQPSARSHTIDNAECVIVEGLFALVFPEARDLFDLKIYVDSPEEVRAARRILRDVQVRGRSLTSVLRQLTDTVLPAHETFVEPTREYADMILDGRLPVEQNVDRILGIPSLSVAEKISFHH